MKKTDYYDSSFLSQNKTLSINDINENYKNHFILMKNVNDISNKYLNLKFFYLDEISFPFQLDDYSTLSTFYNDDIDIIKIKILFIHDDQLKIILPIYLVGNKNNDERWINFLENLTHEINSQNENFSINNNLYLKMNIFSDEDNFHQFFPIKEQFEEIMIANNHQIEFICNVEKENFEKYLENKIIGKFLNEFFSSSSLIFDDEYSGIS